MIKNSFECIGAHTCGNPVRVVIGSGPELERKDMSARRQHFLREFDWILTGLMFEPRGHWLKLQPEVQAFCSPTPQYGGSGATNVLLVIGNGNY